jgi:hypothetical protein
MESLKKPPFRANHVARRFSSTGLGNKLTIDDQIEKLALVAPVAGDVWGGAAHDLLLTWSLSIQNERTCSLG